MVPPVCLKEPLRRKGFPSVPFVFFVVRKSFFSLRWFDPLAQAIRGLRGLPAWLRRLPGDWPKRFWKAVMKLFTWE